MTLATWDRRFQVRVIQVNANTPNLACQSIFVRRRDLVCGGGAVMFSALLASLLRDTGPSWAGGINGSIPEVDHLAVRVVVDSYQIAVAPSLKTGTVEVERFGWPLSDQPPDKAIISEFGLSTHAVSQRGSEIRNVLVDFGYTSEALLNNAELLGIDPSHLDALVLSHGHYDHFGGLVGFLQQNKGKLKPKLPLYLGSEECFCSRQWTAPPLKGNFGALDHKALEGADVKVTFAEVPALVADHAFTTGQINLASFEKVLSPSVMKIGVWSSVPAPDFAPCVVPAARPGACEAGSDGEHGGNGPLVVGMLAVMRGDNDTIG